MLRFTQYVDPETRALREKYDIDVPRQGLLEWISQPISALGRWIDLLLIEKRKWENIPWKHRIRGWRHGFSSHSYHLYELDNKDPTEYLSDSTVMRFESVPNGRYNEAIFSKVVFARFLKSLDAPQPAVLGYLYRRRFYPESGADKDAIEGIRALLDDDRKLVFRPSYGGGGTGIMFIEFRAGEILVNAHPVDSTTFDKLLGGLHDYLVTEFVQQASYAREIFPDATNTLRILTLWDCEKNAPFVASACHRFGRTGSGPLDNFHAGAGGLSAPIDPLTGRIGPAAIREGDEIKRISKHPDTGRSIEGVTAQFSKTRARAASTVNSEC